MLRCSIAIAAVVVFCAVGAACLGSGAIKRSYYVLHGVSISGQGRGTIAGLVRVRSLDAAAIYEKFQIVIRRSPYELAYSETDVWAVKPNQMVSDVIAEALTGGNHFTSVARELGDLRPDYILSGDLNAIEVYVSDDLWYAHLAIVLQLSRFEDGATLLTYKFDERKRVPAGIFAQAARAVSELLSKALDELITELDNVDVPRTIAPTQGQNDRVIRGATDETPGESGEETTSETDETIYVPVRSETPEEPSSD